MGDASGSIHHEPTVITQDFARRINSARTSITGIIDGIQGTTSSRLVNPLDTGLGMPDHAIVVEENRRQNARIQKTSHNLTRGLYDILEQIATMTNPQEVWAFLNQQLPRNLLTPENRQKIIRADGGIDWNQVFTLTRANLSTYKLNGTTSEQIELNKLYALQALYGSFWK